MGNERRIPDRDLISLRGAKSECVRCLKPLDESGYRPVKLVGGAGSARAAASFIIAGRQQQSRWCSPAAPTQFGCEATRIAAPITNKCVTMKRAKGGSNFIVWASGVIRTINPRLPPLVPEWGLCWPVRSCT